MSEIKNYRITSTHLGYEADGVFTFYLRLKGADGIHASVGGYALDSPDNRGSGLLTKRSLTFKGVTLIAKILDTVGVANWEELKGQYIRVEDNGLGSYTTKFGNLIEDKWIDLDDYFKEGSRGLESEIYDIHQAKSENGKSS